MEQCRICGRMVSGSDGDVYMGEDGMLHGKSFTVCDYCAHHENPKRLVALDKLSPKGEVHLRTLRARG